MDTGPIVALLNAADRDHERCRDWLRSYRGVLLTTEAVVTETTHPLQADPRAQREALAFVLSGALSTWPLSPRALAQCRELMERYEDVPMDFIDATLVVAAEELDVRRVATLDRRGFSAYRRVDGAALEIVPG